MKRRVPEDFWARIAEASEMRRVCLQMPRIYSARERRHLEAFEQFQAGGDEPSARALSLGLERLFRRGQYLQMQQLADRISVRDPDVETYLNVSAQAVEQQAKKP